MATGGETPSWLKVSTKQEQPKPAGGIDGMYECWIRAVRDSVGDPDYTLRKSKKADTVFEGVAHFLRRWSGKKPSVLCEYIKLQVDHAVRNNVKLWVTILSGPKAEERWNNQPSQTEVLQHLKSLTAGQAKLFSNLVTRYGDDFPYESPMVTISHIFLAFMKHQTGKDIPEDLLEDAKADLRREPLYDQVYPIDFIGRLR